MAIALFFFCSLLLGTSLGQYGSDRTLNQMFGGVADVVNQGIDVAQGNVKLATQLTGSAVEHGTNLGKMGVAAGTTLTRKGLGGVADLGKQGLDLVGTVAEIIPGAELLPVRTVTDIGKTGVTVLNNIGQEGIKSAGYLGNEVLDKTKTLAKITTGTVGNLASAGSAIAKDTVSTAANAAANVLNTGMDALMAFIPGGSTKTNAIPDIPKAITQPAIAKPIPENKIAKPIPENKIAKPESKPSGGIGSYLSSGLSLFGR
uniref:Hemolysin-like secreted salivary protein 1 n=1 Tax=Triatoma matogrossensis TaxID=162370 RepID=E2J784_9HEMI